MVDFPYLIPPSPPSDLIPFRIENTKDEDSDTPMSDDDQLSDTSIKECPSCIKARKKATKAIQACKKKNNLKRKIIASTSKASVKLLKKPKVTKSASKVNVSNGVRRKK